MKAISTVSESSKAWEIVAQADISLFVAWRAYAADKTDQRAKFRFDQLAGEYMEALSAARAADVQAYDAAIATTTL